MSDHHPVCQLWSTPARRTPVSGPGCTCPTTADQRPSAPATATVPGYLYPMPRGSYAGAAQPILLKVACPCGRWHTHGAGTAQEPMDYPAGTVTRRAGHCQTQRYTAVEVQAETFRPGWSTSAGRVSVAYRTRSTRPGNVPHPTR